MRPGLPLDHLELAVLFDGLLAVIAAGDDADPRAHELLFRTLPPPLMESAGFLDPRRASTTRRFERALAEGRQRLGRELPVDEGASLCRHLWTMAAIDGVITAPQIDAIHACGRALGVDDLRNDSVGVGLLRALSRRGDEVLVPQTWVDGLGRPTAAVRPARQVALPVASWTRCFEGRAEPLVGDEATWLRLQRVVAPTLRALAVEGAGDVVAWWSLLTVFDAHGAAEERVALHLSWSGATPEPGALPAVVGMLGESWPGLADQGGQPLPETAFPALAMVQGALLQLWLPDERGLVAMGIKRDGPGALAYVYGMQPHACSAGDFVDDVEHAIVG